MFTSKHDRELCFTVRDLLVDAKTDDDTLDLLSMLYFDLESWDVTTRIFPPMSDWNEWVHNLKTFCEGLSHVYRR